MLRGASASPEDLSIAIERAFAGGLAPPFDGGLVCGQRPAAFAGIFARAGDEGVRLSGVITKRTDGLGAGWLS